jgi:Bacteriophage tail sheath protein
MPMTDNKTQIETSIQTALQQFTFNNNDRQTWTSVISAISAILQQFWSTGTLQGETPADAFTVQCSLNSTMTSQDILDGVMVVNVIMHMADADQPVEVTFTQQMQAS